MAKNLVYKKSTTITLKAVGTLDLEHGTIDIEGEERLIKDLLKDFDNLDVEINMKIKDEEELPVGIEQLDE